MLHGRDHHIFSRHRTSDPCVGSNQSLPVESAVFWPYDGSSPAGSRLLHAGNQCPPVIKLLPPNRAKSLRFVQPLIRSWLIFRMHGNVIFECFDGVLHHVLPPARNRWRMGHFSKIPLAFFTWRKPSSHLTVHPLVSARERDVARDHRRPRSCSAACSAVPSASFSAVPSPPSSYLTN
jgi:hypothetical protein